MFGRVDVMSFTRWEPRKIFLAKCTPTIAKARSTVPPRLLAKLPVARESSERRRIVGSHGDPLFVEQESAAMLSAF